jgi:hypothetical protein
MKSFDKTMLGAVLVAAALAATALAGSFTSALAAVACTGSVCWHIHENYAYPPGSNVKVHPDDWPGDPNQHYEWREHDGQGYWHGDVWREY